MDALLAGLNDAQRSAVTSPASVLQVLAPPGSGKTKTLTARVTYLINNNGFLPWNIIVCTFTIKAAREMKERIRGIVGEGIEKKLILGTFHSIARRFLVSYGHHIGIPKDFGIADTSDTLAILKRITKRNSYNIEPSAARSRISSQKARSISADQFAASTKNPGQQEFASVYTEYEETLKASNLLDYDDLLLRCVDLLRKYPNCVSNIQAVLIDEFQDTNHVQYELMGLFAQQRNNITIVGDPDQSIYGFRSAEIKNLGRMQQQYPETVVVTLEENYRSSGAILLSALEVIEQDKSRPAKKLLSTHCPGERPVLRRLPSSAAEAKWIVSEIQRCCALTGKLLRHGDFAILLRSASLSRHIESCLGKAGIPYRMVGGHRFFDRHEVKLILDYLRVINQPEHNDALVRVINVPSRKIGEVTIKSLLEEAETAKVSLWSIILSAAQGNGRPKTNLSKPAQRGLEGFVNVILSSRQKMSKMDDESCTLIELISHVLKKLSFQEYLKKSYPEDHDTRWSNVEELVAQATDMTVAIAEGEDPNDDSLPAVEGAEQRETASAGDALARFLANVALSTEVERAEGESTAEQVTISTIHAAKGLEWPVVFIPAAYEGSIPHSRADDTDEERRLLYVGMTRAQALLNISCPVKNSQREETAMSPFLKSARCFDNKGPSIGYKVAQDLSRILRRECPREDVVIESRSQLERVEDDLWPIDGEDIPQRNQPHPSNNGSSDATSTGFGNKRRKLGVGFNMAAASTYVVLHDHGEIQTRQPTLENGFVSAGMHFQTIRQQEALQQDDRWKKSNAKKYGTTQGNITSFFKSRSGVASSVSRNDERKAPFIPPQLSNALSDISNIQYNATSSPGASANSGGWTHKPRTAPMTGRPRKESEANTGSSRYILLSSSPVKVEDTCESSKIAELDDPAEVARSKHNKSVDSEKMTRRDYRPVSTFHATTVSQIGGMQPQRRTLGMRRSLQGWSARSSRPPGDS